MKVLLYNTGTCCHCNEFKGMFKTEESALESYIKYEDAKSDMYFTILEKSDKGYEYEIFSICKKTKHKISCGFLDVEDIEINSLY